MFDEDFEEDFDIPLYDIGPSGHPMKVDDPAYWMLQNGLDEMEGRRAPGWVTQTHPEIYKASCYICRDPEFALMGMSVCKPCPTCGAHWAADDSDCDNGCDVQAYYERVEG